MTERELKLTVAKLHKLSIEMGFLTKDLVAHCDPTCSLYSFIIMLDYGSRIIQNSTEVLTKSLPQ